MLERQLKTLLNFVQNEKNDLIEQTLTAVDLMNISESILNKMSIGTMTEEEALFAVLTISQYIETDTTMESPISDELYDNLHARYVEITGHGIVGTNNTFGSNKPLKQHKYPELRGSLGKVHFIRTDSIPKKDSRKSYEDFLMGVSKKANIGLGRINIAYGLKYDGLSAVFECCRDKIITVLTRKDTENNIGVDITHVFRNTRLEELIDIDVLNDLCNRFHDEYGIKTEIFMTQKDFEEFKKLVVKPPKNRRSAVSMILNTSEDEFDPNWTQYLTIKALQLSTVEPVAVNDISELQKTSPRAVPYYPIYIGMCNMRHQYMLNLPQFMYDEYLMDQLDILNIEIDNVQHDAEENGIPIDGVVCTIVDNNIIETLGRKDNINQFQIAYKIPAGIKKTKLLDVQFQVGPVAGTITPVAIVEPVKIMGNTIDSPGLSNLAKLNRLDLNIGDEVYIKYDIVPTLFKTDDCIKGTGKHIDPITHCPICGEELNITEDYSQARCVNLQCPSKTTGKIYNFINKMGIPNIGLSTVELLVGKGFLEIPGDLYRLVERRGELTSIPGFGDTSVDNLIKSISSKRSVYIHELFGSIGIPDVGRRTMKKITDDGSIKLMELLIEDDTVIDRLSAIKGIGEQTAIKICSGILRNRYIIDDLLRYVEIKPYETETVVSETVLFTKVRDPEFATYLTESKLANVVDSYTKSVTIVITPDKFTKSSKVDKAVKDGKLVMSIDEAYERFGYTRKV